VRETLSWPSLSVGETSATVSSSLSTHSTGTTTIDGGGGNAITRVSQLSQTAHSTETPWQTDLNQSRTVSLFEQPGVTPSQSWRSVTVTTQRWQRLTPSIQTTHR